MRKIIQIKGTHGSGKSTICKQLIGLSSDVQILNWENGKPYATLLNDLGWAILGIYPEHTVGGGCDNLHVERFNLGVTKTDGYKLVLSKLINDYPNYWVVFEGAFLGDTMSIYNYLLTFTSPTIVALISNPNLCMQRIELRRGSPLSSDNSVKAKASKLERQLPLLNPERVIKINVDGMPKEDMVYEFLSVIGWKPNG